jgi:hypothetical protein
MIPKLTIQTPRVYIFNMRELREIESAIMHFKMRADGIIEAYPNPHWRGEVGVKEIQEEIRVFKELTQGVPRPFLLTLPNVTVSKGAREYASSLPSMSVGIAIVIKNSFHRILGNFFMGMNRIASPLRLFYSETEALAWLKELQKTVPHS